jgi:hypothetical protein
MDDEETAGDEDDAGTEFVEEIVKLVGVAPPPVCVDVVDIVDISVVVVRMEVRVTEGITIVVGGSTETTVVVNEEGGSVELE